MSHNRNGNYVLFSTGSRAPTRNWSRLQNNRVCLTTTDLTFEDLAERRKYETLQHNQNKGSSTKSQRASVMARRGGISTTRNTQLNSSGTVYTLNNCDATSGAGIYHPPSASGLRGTWNIQVNQDFLDRPLVDYLTRNPTLSSGGLGMSDIAPNSVPCMSSAPTVTTPATTGLNRRIELNWNTDIAGCYDILGYDIAIQSKKSLHLGGDLIYAVKQEWVRDLNAYDSSYVLGEVNIMKSDISYGFFRPIKETEWYKTTIFTGSSNDKQGDAISIGQDGSYSLYVLSTTDKLDPSFVDNVNINNNTKYRRRVNFARSHDFGNNWEPLSDVIKPERKDITDLSRTDIGEYLDTVIKKGINAGQTDLSNNKIFVNYSTSSSQSSVLTNTRLSNSNNDGGFVIRDGIYSTAVNHNYPWSDLSLGFEHPNTTTSNTSGFGKYISNDMSSDMIYTVFSSISGDTTSPFDSSLIIAFGDTNANNPIYKDGSNCVIDASALLSPINSFAVQNPTGLDGCGNFYVAYRREVNGIGDVSLAFAKTTDLSENTIWDISGIDNVDISGGVGDNAKNQNVSCFAGYGEHYSKYVYVAYYDSEFKALKFARSDNCGNDWEIQYIDGSGTNDKVITNYNNSTEYNPGTGTDNVGEHCSLVGETCIRTIDVIQKQFDVSMYLFISYYHNTDVNDPNKGNLKCAFNPVNGEAGKWIISTIDTGNVGRNSKMCILRDKRDVPYPNIVYRETDGVTSFNVKYARPTQYLDIPLINNNQYECTVTPVDILGRDPCKITRPVGSVIGEPIGNAGPCTDFSGESFDNTKVALSWILPTEFNAGDLDLLDTSGIKISVSENENDFTTLITRSDGGLNPIYLPGIDISYDVTGLENGTKYYFRIETANRPTTNPINTSDIIFSPELGTSTSAAQNLDGNSVIDTSGQPLTVPTVKDFEAIWLNNAKSVELSWKLSSDGRKNSDYTVLDDDIIFDISMSGPMDLSYSLAGHSNTDSSFVNTVLGSSYDATNNWVQRELPLGSGNDNYISYKYSFENIIFADATSDNKWFKFIMSARNKSIYDAGNGVGRSLDISHNESNNKKALIVIETSPLNPVSNFKSILGFWWGGGGQYGNSNSSGLNNLPFLRYEVQYKLNTLPNWVYFDIGDGANNISYAGDILLDTSAGYNPNSDISSANLGSVDVNNINWNLLGGATTTDYYNNYLFKVRVVALGTSNGEIFSEWSNPI